MKMFNKDGNHLSAKEICLVFGGDEIIGIAAMELAEMERQIEIGNQEHEKASELRERLDAIDNAKPSEAMETLKEIKKWQNSFNDYCKNELKTIESYINQAEQFKAKVKRYLELKLNLDEEINYAEVNRKEVNGKYETWLEAYVRLFAELCKLESELAREEE